MLLGKLFNGHDLRISSNACEALEVASIAYSPMIGRSLLNSVLLGEVFDGHDLRTSNYAFRALGIDAIAYSRMIGRSLL